MLSKAKAACGHRKVQRIAKGIMCFQCGSFKIYGRKHKFKKLPPEVEGSFMNSGFLFGPNVSMDRIAEIDREVFGNE